MGFVALVELDAGVGEEVGHEQDAEHHGQLPLRAPDPWALDHVPAGVQAADQHDLAVEGQPQEDRDEETNVVKGADGNEPSEDENDTGREDVAQRAGQGEDQVGEDEAADGFRHRDPLQKESDGGDVADDSQSPDGNVMK